MKWVMRREVNRERRARIQGEWTRGLFSPLLPRRVDREGAITSSPKGKARLPSGAAAPERHDSPTGPIFPAMPETWNDPMPVHRGASWSIAWTLAAIEAAYTRAEATGFENLPDGPALLVGNHGIFGIETPVFYYLLHQRTGRTPVGMAERMFCKLGPMRALLQQLGGLEGTRENALSSLAQGEWVLCYPGGAREVFKGRGERHCLSWGEANGFVAVAREAQVPVVPFAACGVDDTYRVLLGTKRIARALGRNEKYAVPLAIGLGPLPLPAHFRFVIGKAVPPPPLDADVALLAGYRHSLEQMVRCQLAQLEQGS